jgi:16S rRNA (cytidine1402-2'-O)-methyltransferase
VSGTLYLVGTPIGNLDDMTDRGRRVLSGVDVIAAEDTRRTGRLLKALGINGRLVSFYEGNEQRRVGELIAQLQGGHDVALVTDAGMPGISDPGYRLVAACVEAGVTVDVAPGPSAGLAALVISGLPTDRFVFEGFLPRSGRARRDRLAALAAEPRTAVLFESPQRVAATLADLLRSGDRRVAVARELTKLHQEVLRGRLSEVLKRIEERGGLKGEVVVVLEGAERTGASADEAVRVARELVSRGLSKREAARKAREQTGGGSAREIYQQLIS